MSATRSGRQLSRASAPLLKKIRELAAEEVIRALVAGAEVSTVRQIAELVAECDARLERRLEARLERDETRVQRRQRIAGEALKLPPDARGPRSARRSDARTTARGVDPRITSRSIAAEAPRSEAEAHQQHAR